MISKIHTLARERETDKSTWDFQKRPIGLDWTKVDGKQIRCVTAVKTVSFVQCKNDTDGGGGSNGWPVTLDTMFTITHTPAFSNYFSSIQVN